MRELEIVVSSVYRDLGGEKATTAFCTIVALLCIPKQKLKYERESQQVLYMRRKFLYQLIPSY